VADARPEPSLNPAQTELLAVLRGDPADRPTFDAGLRHELRAALEDACEPLVEHLGTKPLYVAKHPLERVLGCEGQYLAEEAEPFAWTPPIARGVVAHKAIELAVSWRGEPVPGDLVAEAIARLTDGSDGLADWLQTASETDHAELQGVATDRVAGFLELFPPLRRAWRPVTESKVRVELFDGAIVLSGKIDLSLGQADGTTAGKVLIDLKTGSPRASHIDDLRFYAVLETIRVGTPPRLLASVYLDQGRPMVEEVTVDVLAAGVRRTIGGASRMVALARRGEAPVLRPSFGCTWCPALPTCETGQQHLAAEADRPTEP